LHRSPAVGESLHHTGVEVRSPQDGQKQSTLAELQEFGRAFFGGQGQRDAISEITGRGVDATVAAPPP